MSNKIPMHAGVSDSELKQEHAKINSISEFNALISKFGTNHFNSSQEYHLVEKINQDTEKPEIVRECAQKYLVENYLKPYKKEKRAFLEKYPNVEFTGEYSIKSKKYQAQPEKVRPFENLITEAYNFLNPDERKNLDTIDPILRSRYRNIIVFNPETKKDELLPYLYKNSKK